MSHPVQILSRVTSIAPLAPSRPLVALSPHTCNPLSHRWVIVNVKNGLGNRLRAFASAASVAASLGRPVMVVWVSDLHCNCSLRNLLQLPREIVVLEEELPLANLTADQFQVPSLAHALLVSLDHAIQRRL